MKGASVVVKIVGVLLVAYMLILSVLYFNQERIIFLGDKLDSDYQFNFKADFEERTFTSSDSTNIHALHFKIENPKGIIVYYHGNKGNIARWGSIREEFLNLGYDVFIMDYRTFGKSTGQLDEQLMYEDAQLCFDYIKSRYTPDKISIYGRSLGCAFAIKIAADNEVHQLICESPFFNMADAAKGRYSFAPVDLLLKYKFESNLRIGEVGCRTTFFHGTTDKVISFESGEKLYFNADLENSEFVKIDGGNHHNLITYPIYQKKMRELLGD